MKKITKRLISSLLSLVTLISCATLPTYADNTEGNENLSLESNYASTLQEYNKHQVGDIVEFDTGMKFVIWSHEIMTSEIEDDNYYIHTEYVEYNPTQKMDFNSENILSAVAYSGDTITPYFAATNTHTFGNTTNVFTATNLTRFMYDGTNFPAVYASEYRFSNSTYMTFKSWDLSTNFLTKSATQKLSYTYQVYDYLDASYETRNSSVSVTCKKDGTQG